MKRLLLAVVFAVSAIFVPLSVELAQPAGADTAVHCGILILSPPYMVINPVFGPLVSTVDLIECNQVTNISVGIGWREALWPYQLRYISQKANTNYAIISDYLPCNWEVDDVYPFGWSFQQETILAWTQGGVWQPTVAAATAMTNVPGCGPLPPGIY